MQDILKSAIEKVNKQNGFIKASVYILGGFSIVLSGYGIGRLIILLTY